MIEQPSDAAAEEEALSEDKLLALLKKQTAKVDKLSKELEAANTQNKKLVAGIKKLDAINNTKASEKAELEQANKEIGDKLEEAYNKIKEQADTISALKTQLLNKDQINADLNKELAKAKEAQEIANKEKSEQAAEGEKNNVEMKKLKAALVKANKVIEEMKTGAEQDKKELNDLKNSQGNLDQFRKNIAMHWPLDPSFSTKDTNPKFVKVISRILVEDQWWFCVQISQNLTDNSESKGERRSSADTQKVTFWTTREVFLENFAIEDPDKVTEDGNAVHLGAFQFATSVQHEIEVRMKSKFDQNWKTASLRYEELVKEVVSF
jgi:myosin heavy subunit